MTLTSKHASNIKVSQNMYRSFLEGDLDTFSTFLHDNIVWEFPGVPGVLPLTGRYEGPKAVLDWMVKLASEMEILRFEMHQFLSDEEGRVVVLGSESVNIRSTNKQFFTRWAHELEFKNSKVIRFYEHTDTATQVDAYNS